MPYGISERAESRSDLPLMSTVSKLIALLLVVLSAPSSAEARRWRYYGDSERYSRSNDTQERPSSPGFAAALEQWIRGCKLEASEWKTWPLEAVAQIARSDDAQRNALSRRRQRPKTWPRRSLPNARMTVPHLWLTNSICSTMFWKVWSRGLSSQAVDRSLLWRTG